MRTDALLGFAASLLLTVSLTACGGGDPRHSPEAHMNQNADRYQYIYDDGVCSYQYEFDFKELTDHLEQHGDCRNVPIQRYHPEAAIAPAYPPPAAAPPAGAPPAADTGTEPSVSVGTPAPAASASPPGPSPAITATPVQ